MTETRAIIILLVSGLMVAGIALNEISKHISLPSPSLHQVTECGR